ncbi:hypothetical protein OJJOAM_003823 [Cupriavidus sp. H18C1]
MPDRRTYFVSLDDVPGYHPANHVGTLNRRLIGPETVGARHLEVVHGTIEKGKGALPHAHPGIEQVCYLLEGRALAEVGGQRRELGPGDCCFFPRRRDACVHGGQRRTGQGAGHLLAAVRGIAGTRGAAPLSRVQP